MQAEIIKKKEKKSLTCGTCCCTLFRHFFRGFGAVDFEKEMSEGIVKCANFWKLISLCAGNLSRVLDCLFDTFLAWAGCWFRPKTTKFFLRDDCRTISDVISH